MDRGNLIKKDSIWGLMTVVAIGAKIRYKPDGVDFFLLFHLSLLEVAKHKKKWIFMENYVWVEMMMMLSLSRSLSCSKQQNTHKNASTFQHKHFLDIVLVSGHCFHLHDYIFYFFHALIFNFYYRCMTTW